MTSLVRRLVIVLVACIVTTQLCIGGEDEAAPTSHAPWTARTLELFGSLPVQDGGRIKPLSTYAAFTLLRLNGKRTVTSNAGGAKNPVDWLLDVCFYPDIAIREPVFLVSDVDAVGAIGVSTEGKHKRDRWTYAELQPGMPKLFSLAHDYDAIAAKDRSTLQQQVVDLAGNVMSFLRLARSFDFARGGDARSSDALALIPPDASARADSAWLTPADVLGNIGPTAPLSTASSALIQELEALAKDCAHADAFESTLASVHARLVAMAEVRGEYEHVPLERAYYELDLIGWSLYTFIAAFVIAALSWLRPKNRKLGRALPWVVLVAALLLVAAIVLRCIIRGRPPVSTLYETVLFVTAVGTLAALFLEWVHRSRSADGAARIAVSAAAFLGMVGLFIANGYETLDKQDTMPSLVAVLDTNFWLATHVTCITIGYSAGMLAALLASVYLVGKLVGPLVGPLVGRKRGDTALRRELARMVYGVLCFALIFATIGTILGGIWANESWGRFWGWDPKENGALLIVITTLVILHARRGGFLRDHGTCMAAAFLGTVVAFSWWGVNLLGVGLHSYGFTSGIHTALWSYYGLQWGIVALGGIAAWRERRASAKGLPHPAAQEATTSPSGPRSRAKRSRTAA
jgi:ABC-type transport system involved in cytochrome c biogenesis permease subunit